MWCLHGIVKALNLLSRLSLRQWCQAVAQKKDGFINDLINHQNSSPPHSSLFNCSCLPITVPWAFLYIADKQKETHTHTHLLFLRHCNTSRLVLSLSSPDFQLAPSQTRQQKSQKSNVATIQEAAEEANPVNYLHKRTTVSQPAQN